MHLRRFHFDQIDSTNWWAKRHASRWTHEQMLLVTASYQTEGRGRRNRRWHSPPGLGIHATFCFFSPFQEESALSDIALVAAVAVASVLDALGFSPQLKWPNDLLLHDKKVAGILCETSWVEGKPLLIVGIGINVNTTLDQLQTVGQPATSLLVEGGKPLDMEQVLAVLQENFIQTWERYRIEGRGSLLLQYIKYLKHRPGSLLRFHRGEEVILGEFVEVAGDGSLVLRTAEGNLARFIAGEIE
jgi:BirA family biotin operon repressor/biotin-[acetyl-CoA-carboxylase] ligase